MERADGWIKYKTFKRVRDGLGKTTEQNRTENNVEKNEYQVKGWRQGDGMGESTKTEYENSMTQRCLHNK